MMDASDAAYDVRLDSMTDDEIRAAAISDPDAQPLTDEQLARMRRGPPVGLLRRRLKLSAEAFAERYHIPVDTLRDWEENGVDPGPAARAYLRVIIRHPDMVAEVLAPARARAA